SPFREAVHPVGSVARSLLSSRLPICQTALLRAAIDFGRSGLCTTGLLDGRLAAAHRAQLVAILPAPDAGLLPGVAVVGGGRRLVLSAPVVCGPAFWRPLCRLCLQL